jgi:hypothetical protein
MLSKLIFIIILSGLPFQIKYNEPISIRDSPKWKYSRLLCINSSHTLSKAFFKFLCEYQPGFPDFFNLTVLFWQMDGEF